MSRLPIRPLPTTSIEIAGEPVTFRSLSRTEALKMGEFKGRESDAEIFLLTCGMDCTEDEARAFHGGTTTDEAGLLIDAIIEFSGLSKKPPVEPQGDGRRAPKEPST